MSSLDHDNRFLRCDTCGKFITFAATFYTEKQKHCRECFIPLMNDIFCETSLKRRKIVKVLAINRRKR